MSYIEQAINHMAREYSEASEGMFATAIDPVLVMVAITHVTSVIPQGL